MLQKKFKFSTRTFQSTPYFLFHKCTQHHLQKQLRATQHLSVCWHFWLQKASTRNVIGYVIVFAVCILLIGHLFSSSATSLKTIKLASSCRTKSLTAFQIGSSVTALNSNITKLELTNLVRYVVDVTYTDSLCSTFSFAIQVLNKCFRDSEKYIIATSTAVLYVSYTDAQCTLGKESIPYSYTSKVCSGSRMTFISETSDFTTTVPIAFQRWMNVWNIT